MHTPLNGKVALVTGGARGIGAVTAKKLATHGAAIAITYSKSAAAAENVVAEIVKAGGKAKAYLADAAKPDTMQGLVDSVLKDFGALDILVNNAGIFETGLIGQTTMEDYMRTRAINIDTVFALTNAAVPHMKAGARIISISSVLGERSLMAGLGTYNASKFAVNGFTRSWARDLAGQGILVNAVQPGPINTEMNPEDSDAGRAQLATIPLGRYGRAEDIAGAVAFLAGPDSTFITGITLTVDGGLIA